MKKTFVKLKDTGSAFHDVTTQQTITGKCAVEVSKSARLEKAIRGGALVEMSEEEAKAHNALIPDADKPTFMQKANVKAAEDAKPKVEDKKDDEDDGTKDAKNAKKK